MGMTIFCMFAAFALRRRDLAGPDIDKATFIGEGGSRKGKVTVIKPTSNPTGNNGQAGEKRRTDKKQGWADIDRLGMYDTGVRLSRHSTGARDRIQERAKKRKEKIAWGEFK
jgi:hypothetical protein